MKKITLFFSVFLFSLLSLLSSTVYANKRTVEIRESSFLWLSKSYAPTLDLQPYFNFIQQNLAAAAAPCAVQTLPFLEDFNTGSTTLACWTIVDENKDSTSPTGSYIWRPYEYGTYEGTHSMYFSGNSKNDDWLISPTFKLDATKIYKLKYMYKTTTSYINEFEVLASNKGVGIVNFTKTVVPKRKYNSGDWIEETAFITNFSGDVNFAWHVTTQTYTYVYLDNVSLQQVDCVEPVDLGVKGVKTNEVTAFWTDPTATSWEYYVDVADGVGPAGAGTASTTNEAIITKDHLNKNLTQNTAYEYYVRSKCADGAFGEWAGPFKFYTSCTPVAVPFSEGFNTNSTTINCWKILDNNKDATSPTGNNIFKQSNSTPHEGDRAMYFYGSTSGTTHDDWLISPTVKMNGGIYAITYYYKTSSSYDNEFEVLLSKDGQAPSDFKTPLEAKAKRNTSTYVKKTLYVKDIIGDVNIAWHMVAKGYAYLYIDLVTIEEVSCIAPNADVKATKIEKNNAEFSWTDPNNTSWEYYVQLMGAGTAPIGSGSIATKNSAAFSKTSGTGSTNLQPNTWYEFFVRSSCGAGKTSLWVGPIAFKTPCDFGILPFWEGFNTTSKTVDCWTIVDNNKDRTQYEDNIWKTYNYGAHEGDKSMYYSGYTNTHDDWLISPSFKFDAKKFYRLKFHYKTSTYNKTDFEVLLSNKGIALTDFTKVLFTAKADMTADYKQITAIIGLTGGDIAIAWHVMGTSGNADLYVDNVFIEEVIGCPEPTILGVKDEKENAATINWVDDYGKDWEHVVQKAGGKAPTTAGTATKTKDNIVTKDQAGVALQPNTEYEFYVRTTCGNGEFSIWSGPFKFKTACGQFTTPFWEGFNTNSKSIGCWTIIDANNDRTTYGDNIWKTYDYGQYEGNQMMYFYGYQSDKAKLPHNDWLISPRIKFETGKTYRLKYHYKVSSSTSYDYEFEVLSSTAGLDTKNFTKNVVAKKKYAASSDWKEEYVFITATSGDVNIAWHITSATTATYLYLDNVFIEEVTGCPEPLKLGAKDMETNKATISWTDEFAATSWQYYIQESGKPAPAAATAGTATTAKTNTVTTEQSGKTLSSNTDYEFYVRTVCGNGQYSIWNGPFKFTTLCGLNAIPFWEGFNKDSKTSRCWVNLDKKGLISPLGGNWKTTTSMFEGDQAIYTSIYDSKKEPYNDYLVSPTVTMDGGMYILKYHYKTSTTTSYNNDFEVLISTQGVDATKFTTKVLPSANHRIGNYVEQVVFINNVKGDVNIAWHMLATNTTYSYLYLDNIHLKKVETCPEPYYVKVSNPTSTSLDVEWTQDGGSTNWEVIVVNYGDDATATPVKTVPVSGTPKTTIQGLDPNKMYTVYVRSKCVDGKSNSDWSTSVIGGTKVGNNDDCTGAVVIPINQGNECDKTVAASFFGSTVSTVVEPSCATTSAAKKDIWFEFTATDVEHVWSMSDYLSMSNAAFPTLYGTLYDKPCASITSTAVECFTINSYGDKFRIFKNLVVGQKYYLRIATALPNPDFYFNMCITTPKYIATAASGTTYTVEQLVKDVLVIAECDLVSNVTYRTGTNFGAEPNGIGYFEKRNAPFAFKDGIILATNGVERAKGPSGGALNSGTSNWKGDDDLRDLLLAGGEDGNNLNASVIEFDFIPITDTIKFDFVFASNEYGPSYQCGYSDVFAFFLTDLETDITTNLAVVPGTDIPVSVTTIRDARYQGPYTCGDTNKEYFDKFYYGDSPGLPNANNPINYYGMTIPMKAMSAVKPGKKYHIKLAIADNKDSGVDSAVFLEGGSFDLGRINLGNDLLVENGTALCSGESRFIKSGVPAEGVLIKWYKDEVLIAGADQPDLEVVETGVYKITVKYLDLGCETTGSVKVEIFPAISAVVAQPKPLAICRTSLTALDLDLTEVEEAMLAKVDSVNYKMIYYTSKEDAEAGIGSIADPVNYSVETTGVDVMLYIYVEDVRTGCSEIFEWILRATKGTIPTAREHVKVCASYTLPALETDQHYYTQSAAKGIEYQAGDVLTEAKEHTIYVLQDNGGGCYEEISFKVTITAAVKADVFADVELECALHPLAALSEHNKYFTQAGGQGIELAVGSLVPHAQTIYVYAASEDGLCIDESSFKVSYRDCPIQKGISPNGDGKNDRFDLSQHGVNSIVIYNRYGAEVFAFQGAYTDQWYGQDKGGKALPDGTYYYVVIAHGKTKTGWVQINK